MKIQRVLAVLAAVFFIVLLVGFRGDGTASVVSVRAESLPRQEERAVENAGAEAAVEDERENTVLPANRPTTPLLQNPSDPLSIVLSGEMGNGGYWTWEDIGNLLGVYSAYNAFWTVEVQGQPYTGVPLPYLLDYARLNEYARTLVAVSRDETRFAFPVQGLSGCLECLVARSAADTLALLLPGYDPAVVPDLMRIDIVADAAISTSPTEVEIPADSQALFLAGAFARGGLWTWDDVTNLLGVYAQYRAFQTAYVDGQEYVGVPLQYLLDYAAPSDTAIALVFHDRDGERISASLASLSGCAECLIALEEDNTLTLVLPGGEPPRIARLAGIEAR